MNLDHFNTEIKVYGPYFHTNGRHFIVYVSNGIKRSQSLTRFCVEHILGYPLPVDIDVDHIDRDFLNNKIGRAHV